MHLRPISGTAGDKTKTEHDKVSPSLSLSFYYCRRRRGSHVVSLVDSVESQFLSSRSSWASVWELPTTEAEGHAFLQEMSLYVVTPLCSYFIVIVLPVWVRETSWVTWFVIVNVYWTRFCFYRGASDRLFHALDLFMIGMVAQYFGLKGRQVLGDIIHRYWFLVFSHVHMDLVSRELRPL